MPKKQQPEVPKNQCTSTSTSTSSSYKRRLNLLANELLVTSGGATVGAIGTAIATGAATGGIVFPAVGSVIGGIVGFAAIKIIEAKNEN
jgi:hypothetical protein